MVQSQPWANSFRDLILKVSPQKRAGLPRRHEALSSNPSVAKREETPKLYLKTPVSSEHQ
jgi:hypothetical protein